MNYRKRPSANNRDLLKYASMGSQILVLLALTVFAGLKADQWLHTSPLFACALPLLSLVGVFVKTYRDTSRKK
jgi:hypothetical protein